jgi:hypothetical protein
MCKRRFHLVLALVLIAAVQIGFDLTGSANPWVPGSPLKGFSAASPSLVLKIKKKHCERIFVCDYFAPTASCSAPPCCKKGHWEKHCEKKPKTSESTLSNSGPESHPCYPICQDKCAKTRGDMTLDQCILDCLAVTRC